MIDQWRLAGELIALAVAVTALGRCLYWRYRSKTFETEVQSISEQWSKAIDDYQRERDARVIVEGKLKAVREAVR